jgi:dTDP-4-dehydrorhamnose 3,5-epimerase-like enzyme
MLMLDTTSLQFTLPAFMDPRGSLVAFERANGLPFTAERFFLVFGVPAGNSRGSHAHREQHQLLVAVQGTVEVDVTDGDTTSTVVLDAPSKGLWLPPLHWATERYLSADAVLLVLASGPYQPGEYIDDLDDLRSLRRAAGL